MRAIFLAAGLCLLPPAAFAQAIEAGHWHITGKFTRAEGGSMMPPKMDQSFLDLPASEKDICIDAAAAPQGLQTILTPPDQQCSITLDLQAAGTLDGERVCTTKTGVKHSDPLHGRVSAGEFAIDDSFGLPNVIKVTHTTWGRRTGACE